MTVCHEDPVSTYHLLPVQRPGPEQPPPFAWATLLLKENEKSHKLKKATGIQ
jgi:hypothetical protein